MIILVLSDSHGRVDNIQSAFDRNRNASEILFLGDGLRDIERIDFGDKSPICVCGNCDTFSGFRRDVPNERILSFGEYTVLMMHGHTHHVKSSLLHAIKYAAEKGADILLYGHTHEKKDLYFAAGEQIDSYVLKKPLRVFNSGSIGAPKEGKASFGIIIMRGKDILTSHGEL